MRYSFLIGLIFCAGILSGQKIERKIVIENGRYFYTTIDEEFQIATLHTGDIKSTISEGKHLAVPAGRNYNDPINPLAWDIAGNDLYAISFLEHSLNDRNEAIKKIDISKLTGWDGKISVADMLMYSVDNNMLTYNDPYRFVTKRSMYLQNFFFDAVHDLKGNYEVVITNESEISIWSFDGTAWSHGEVTKFPMETYFTLFYFKEEMYLMKSTGELFVIQNNAFNKVPNKAVAVINSGGIIVEDRDHHSVKCIESDQIDPNVPFIEILNHKAIDIF